MKNKVINTFSAGILAAAMAAPITSAYAGGVLGDIVNVIAPGAGTALDDAHRIIKDANPKYKNWEEGFTNDVRNELGLTPHVRHGSLDRQLVR